MPSMRWHSPERTVGVATEAPGETLLVVGECSGPPGATTRATELLLAATSATRNVTVLRTQAIASRVDADLRAAPDGGFLFFAAVWWTNENLELCHAGLHRLHELRGSELIHVTRDHVVREDFDRLDPAYRASVGPRDGIHSHVVTRCVGGGSTNGDLAPECVVLPAHAGTSIVVCCSDWHRYRDPSEYVGELCRFRDDGDVPAAHACHFAASIRRQAHRGGSR